jgi:hypothetical protein
MWKKKGGVRLLKSLIENLAKNKVSTRNSGEFLDINEELIFL